MRTTNVNTEQDLSNSQSQNQYNPAQTALNYSERTDRVTDKQYE